MNIPPTTNPGLTTAKPELMKSGRDFALLPPTEVKVAPQSASTMHSWMKDLNAAETMMRTAPDQVRAAQDRYRERVNASNGSDSEPAKANAALQELHGDLLAIQAGVAAAAFRLELSSKVVEHATSGVKTTLNTQI